MIVYRRLFHYLRGCGYGVSYLNHVLSSATVAKLSKNENIDMTTLNKICEYLHVQPDCIMEWVPDDKG